MSITAGEKAPVEITITDGDGEPLTGVAADLFISFLDITPTAPTEGYVFDFGTDTWVDGGAGVAEIALTERANVPGDYYLPGGFDSTGLAGRSFALLFTKSDGVFTTSVPASLFVVVKATGGGAATAQDVTDARDAVLAQGDTAWATATGFAIPADVTDSRDHVEGHTDATATANASTLLAAIGTRAAASALTAAQAGITTLLAGVSLAAGTLTSTAIGSGFVAAVQSGLSTLTAAGVWAVTDGLFTKGAALDLLRRRQTNPESMSASGLVSFKADDGSTEKTSQVRDANGDPYIPSASSAVSKGAEA